MTDKKILRAISISEFAALLLALLVPLGISSRLLGAFITVPAALITLYFIKKRSIPSVNTRQVIMLMTVIALVYLVLLYLSGIHFGFTPSLYKLNFTAIIYHILPIAAIIVCSELIRHTVLASEDKISTVFCYFSCVFAQMLTRSTISGITSFNSFMDLVGATLFPALTANLLYHYISKRYGFYPNIIYRLISSLYLYFIPVKPAISDAILSLVNLVLPIIIYLFIDALFEKKRRYALTKKSIFEIPLTVIAASIMIFVIMVISNQFRIGTLVIATDSMTGELNRGDAAIFERYDDQIINEGQVIVFEKDGSVIIHRVDDIKKVNGVTQYYTKGDVNETKDAGFRTDSDIIGIVNYKIPYVGMPTLWMRSIFKR